MDLIDPLVDGAAMPAALTAQRQRAHALIAKAAASRVAGLFEALDPRPQHVPIRPSDVGLLMVRGRVGGAGGAFNLGELPVARAAVRLDDGAVGIGYVAGRDTAHAELAALSDAMIQSSQWADLLETQVLAPLEVERAHRQIDLGRKAAATKVDFFTLVRTRSAP